MKYTALTPETNLFSSAAIYFNTLSKRILSFWY